MSFEKEVQEKIDSIGQNEALKSSTQAFMIIFAAHSHSRLFSQEIEGEFSTILDVFEQVAPAPDRAKKARAI